MPQRSLQWQFFCTWSCWQNSNGDAWEARTPILALKGLLPDLLEEGAMVVFYFASVYFRVVYCRMPHTANVPSRVGGSWKTKSVCKTTMCHLNGRWRALVAEVGFEPTTSQVMSLDCWPLHHSAILSERLLFKKIRCFFLLTIILLQTLSLTFV